MSKTPTGIELMKLLSKKYGYKMIRQAKGSHGSIALMDVSGERPVTLQLTSKELSIGVLKTISRKTNIPLEELRKA